MIVLPLNLILDLQQESEYGKIQGEPLDVIFGNGWGRNFFFKTFVEQTNHSPNDYEKVASDSIVKVPLQIYMNQRLFGTTIVTNKMNGYDNKPVLMK